MGTTSANESTSRVAPLRYVRGNLPVAEARLAAEVAAVEIVRRINAGMDVVYRDAWRYPFDIARAIRVRGIPARTNVSHLLDAVLAAHNVLEDDFRDHDYEDASNFWDAVAAVWPKVRYGRDEGPPDLAYQHAIEAPLLVPGAHMRSETYRRFIVMAHYLQQLVRTDPIYLPGRRIGALMGVSHVLVQSWVTLARQDGFLALVDGAYSIGRARRFRFVSPLMEAAPR